MKTIKFFNKEGQPVSLDIFPGTYWADKYTNVIAYDRKERTVCDMVQYYPTSDSYAFYSNLDPGAIVFCDMTESTREEFLGAFDEFFDYVDSQLAYVNCSPAEQEELNELELAAEQMHNALANMADEKIKAEKENRELDDDEIAFIHSLNKADDYNDKVKMEEYEKEHFGELTSIRNSG